MAAGKPVVAAFDFDGTIIDSDSLRGFLLAAVGPVRLAASLAVAAVPVAVGYVSGGRDAAKEALLTRVLGGRRVVDLQPIAETYGRELAASKTRAEMVAKIEWHHAAGHRIVIVSASPELWVRPAATTLGIPTVLATRLEVDTEGRLTGRYQGANCRGPEKVRRLEEWLGGDDVHLYAYGDSSGDDELLARADVAIKL